MIILISGCKLNKIFIKKKSIKNWSKTYIIYENFIWYFSAINISLSIHLYAFLLESSS